MWSQLQEKVMPAVRRCLFQSLFLYSTFTPEIGFIDMRLHSIEHFSKSLKMNDFSFLQKTYASALTEVTHPDIRAFLTNHLRDAITLHTEISNLMIIKGWLHPYHISEQFELDMKSSQKASMIAGLELFPVETSRLGTFATPYK